MTEVVIIGGGPGGYESALVAAQHGAQVTVVDRDGLGGSAVLTDCVPSKTLIAVSQVLTGAAESGELGVRINGNIPDPDMLGADLGVVNRRVLDLAEQQSKDIRARLTRSDIRVVDGIGRLTSEHEVVATSADGKETHHHADYVLLATGARPRELPTAPIDGERILNWEQVYNLDFLPDHLIVVGSGVTGAEFANAYRAMGSEVTLVSSRDRVLPQEDADAAEVLESAFARRGVQVLGHSRAQDVRRAGEGVVVQLTDGRSIAGSHCLMAVGSIPNTDELGLHSAGVEADEHGYLKVDRVSRTNKAHIYGAGDCTGVLMLASVAGMQGRIAMWHALGQTVHPMDLRKVSSNIFTDPEIATVGYSQVEVDEGNVVAEGTTLPLATNARAKMEGLTDGFVKLFTRTQSRVVIGGVVVAPKASELIHPITLAVDQHLTCDQLAETFTVYPSLSGSIAEAARRLHIPEE